jgi:hypothetical protein
MTLMESTFWLGGAGMGLARLGAWRGEGGAGQGEAGILIVAFEASRGLAGPPAWHGEARRGLARQGEAGI